MSAGIGIRRALACGLAVVVAACAAEATSPQKPVPISQIREIAEASGAITRNYVDPVDAKVLLDACLQKLPGAGAAIPSRSDKTAQQDPFLSMLPSLREVASALDRVPANDVDAAAQSCIRGMVASLDAYSEFLDAEDFGLVKGAKPASASIGLELALAPEGAEIVGAIEGAPAASAGITSGDLLTAVDDVDLRGRTLNEIIRLLRGPPGSSVTITVQRGQSTAPLRLTLIRQQLLTKSFDGRLLESGFLYLKTDHLTTGMPKEMAETITTLRGQVGGPFRGIVLDLRGCPGGMLQSAIAESAVFLRPGTMVAVTKGRAPESNRRYSADPRDYLQEGGSNPLADLPLELKSAPMVVLIGPQTAAGYEIVAGALQDKQRAVVIGERSCGKGSVQTMIPLKPASRATQPVLKITTARIYRSGGELLDGKGIEPDVVVPRTKRRDGAESAGAPPSAPIDDPVVTRALVILNSDSPVRP